VLEFDATLSGDAFQHIGLALDFNDSRWIMFSTGSGGGALYARTHDGVTPIDTLIPGAWMGTPHRYRIEWTTSSVRFLIDGTIVAEHTASISGTLRPMASDFHLGGEVIGVDWFRLEPWGTSGTFTSRVLDGGAVVNWTSVQATAVIPASTALNLNARFGDTPAPDASWTPFAPIPVGSAPLAATSRYVQYQAVLSGNGIASPVLHDIAFSAAMVVPLPSIGIGDAAIVEGHSGITYAVFQISLSAPSTAPVSVEYATADETALAGADYLVTSGTVEFAPGDTSKTLLVPIVGDLALEPDETFVVNLGDASNATIADSQGQGTIVNDD
jgi:hypothetical protein